MKKDELQENRKSKSLAVYIAIVVAAMLATILIICACVLPVYKRMITNDILYGDLQTESSETVEVADTYNAAQIQDDVTKYVEAYFKTNNISKELSDQDINDLTNTVISSLQEAGLLDQKDNTKELKSTIMTKVKELLADNNTSYEENLTVLKESLQTQIQDNQDLSEKEKKSILDIISSVKYNGISNIEELETKLKELLQNSDSLTEKQIEILNQSLEKLTSNTDTKFTDYKEYYDKLIQENKDLSEQEKQELLEIINDLQETHITDMASLKDNVLEQIKNNKELSDQEIADLQTALAALKEQTSLDLNDFKNYVNDQLVPGIEQTVNVNKTNIANNTSAINQNSTDIQNNSNAITKNSQDIQNNVTSIANLIASYNTMQNNVSDIQNDILNLYGKMDDCEITYNEQDGHFYITYNPGGADSVSKKLDFAQ